MKFIVACCFKSALVHNIKIDFLFSVCGCFHRYNYLGFHTIISIIHSLPGPGAGPGGAMAPAFFLRPGPGGAKAPAKLLGPGPGGAMAPEDFFGPGPGGAMAPTDFLGPGPGGAMAPAIMKSWVPKTSVLTSPPPHHPPL